MLRTFALFLYLLIPTFTLAEGTPPIKVAAVLGLTGQASIHSDAIKKGVLLAVDELKQKGVQVEVRFEDDQTNPAKTVSAIRLLLSQGYKYFIGPTWSFQAKAAEPVLRSENAVALTPTGSSLINGGASEAIFNMCPRRDKQIDPIADGLKKRKENRALIVTPNGDWGEIHRKVYKRAVAEVGGVVVAENSYDYGMDVSSMRSILMRERAKDFSLLFVTGGPADIASLMKAKHQLKLGATVVSSHDLIDAYTLGAVNQKELGGEIFISHLRPPSKSFQKKFKAKFNEEAKLYSDRGYDALLVLTEALRETDQSPKAVKNYLLTKLDFQGSIGRIRFDENGDLADEDYEFISFKAS